MSTTKSPVRWTWIPTAHRLTTKGTVKDDGEANKTGRGVDEVKDQGLPGCQGKTKATVEVA